MTFGRTGAVSVAVVGMTAAATGLWLGAAGAADTPGMVRYSAVVLGTCMLGGFVLWHRPSNRYGLAHLSVGVLFGSLILATGALASPTQLPPWAGQVSLAWSWVVLAGLLPLWVAVIATFPDGRFHRRFLGRVTLGLLGLVLALTTTAYLLFPAGATLPLIPLEVPFAGPLGTSATVGVFEALSATGAVLGAAAPLLAVVALADRYRASGLVVRQQIKWLLVGATVSVLLQAIPVQVIDSGAVRTVAGALVVVAIPLPLLAAALAIFKYGLWEIDVVISQGLVYTLVSAVLSAVFLAAAVAAGLSVGGADGRVVAAVGLALLVSYLARPLRQRLVSLVARTLYGDQPRGLLALSRLDERDGHDARSQGRRVAETACAALGVPWAHAWLFLSGENTGVLRPLAGSGTQPDGTVIVPRHVVPALRELSSGKVAGDLVSAVSDLVEPLVTHGGDAVAAMVVDDDLLGLVVCGARARDPFRDEDLRLLAVLARESALVLLNTRLEGELRQRLEMIEAQASDIRRSRQRLVTVQDEERRRIGRDLHDGAQQQLVALATRLRRAARGREGALAGELDALADEAEEAVFTLQELARGIYPSVLADRGLAVALQAQAARLPVDVRVEVEPGLHGHRLPPELEAVLYYVALEAMTNVVKHAPGARVVVSLHSGERPRAVVLEVHDDGPGVEAEGGSGSGLRNMADRVEAVGGVFSVESAPGRGTWVRAEVVEPGSVTALRGGTASHAGRSALPPPAG